MNKKFFYNSIVITQFLSVSWLGMLFYLFKNSPKGIIDFETAEMLLLERFQLYTLPAALQNDTEEFNYYDRVSHLLMSIIVIAYPQFKDLFFKGEEKLFEDRLKVKNCSVIKEELTEASDYLNALSQSEECRLLKSVCLNQFQLLQNTIQALLSKSRHSFKKNHKKNCRKYKLTLPFTFLLNLVSKREVEVNNGKVSLSCGQWHEILKVVFQFLLRIELTLMENSQCLKIISESEDDRVRQLIRRFVSVLNGSFNEVEEVLEADEIDEKSRYFPPCMANLHQILRRTHRLSYDSRYQYTLFLRDIGLSVDENISFWEKEYRKPQLGATCDHSWRDKGKRYEYQIKHLYGLIGTQERKSSHSCEKFVKKLEMKMDGGCPFQHLTLEELERSLPECVKALPDVEDIFMNKRSGFPQKACAVYLNCLQKVLTEERMNFFDDNVTFNKWVFIVSPLQFYNIARNL